jgi:hypothetical protein
MGGAASASPAPRALASEGPGITPDDEKRRFDARPRLRRCYGMTPEQVLALPGFRDRRADAGGAVVEDWRLAVRDDHPLDRQLRDPLE